MASAIVAKEIGEHLFDITKKVVEQMNGCLERRVGAEDFEQAMAMLDELDSTDGLEKIGCPRGVGKDWLDQLGGGIYDLSEIYEKGVAKGATRFVIFNNQSFISVVAVQGDPGASAIEKCVMESPGDGFKTETQWSSELGEGAQIDLLYNGNPAIATLRDGREIKTENP